MLSLKNSLAVLRKTNALLEGHFVLSSGLHSSIYIQCAKLLSFPNLANKICIALSKKIKTKIKKLIIIPKPPALQASVIGACETNTAANPPSAVNPIMPTLNIPA